MVHFVEIDESLSICGAGKSLFVGGVEVKEYCIETESGKVYYWLSDIFYNDKKVLFFLHGMTADHSMFQEQIKFFSDKYNIILWDAPAHGKSRPYEKFTYEKAAITIKKIFDTNHIESAIFIGQSMGGFIAQAVLKRFSSIVKGFIAIDSTPYGFKYYSKSDVFWLKQIEWMANLYPLGALKKAIAKQVSETTDAYKNMLNMLSSYSKKELSHLMGIGYAGFLSDNCDLTINCPVLLLLGEKDKTGKVKVYNKMWAENTGYELKIIKNAGHNSNVDNPQQANEEIEKFLEKVDRWEEIYGENAQNSEKESVRELSKTKAERRDNYSHLSVNCRTNFFTLPFCIF